MLSDRGRFEEARSLAERLLDQHPHASEVHAIMGEVFAAEGRWNEAVQWYGASLEIDFDPTVMEHLAGARARAVQSGTAPDKLPVGALPQRQAVVEEVEERRRAVPLVVAGVLLATLLLFFSIRWATRPDAPVARGSGSTASPSSTGGRGSGAWPVGSAPAQAAGAGSPAAASSASMRYPTVLPPARTDSRPVHYSGQPPVSESVALARPAADEPESVTAADKKIVRQMHIDKFHEGTSIPDRASAAVDAYSGLGIITIRAPRTADHRRLQYEVVLAAFQAGMSAMKSDARVRALVVRCVGQLTNEQGLTEDVVLFRAALDRQNLRYWLGNTGKPSYQQLTSGLLGGMYWDDEAVARYVDAETRRLEQERASGG